MSPLGIAALSAGANLAGNVISDVFSRQAEDRSYERSLALMKQQNDYNVDMWNRANAYNSPSHQRALLEEAGYNPAMYADGVGFQPASEVTSADASVPYNSSQGQGYRQGIVNVIEALRSEVEIEKLRADIKRLNIDNEDAQLALDARKAKQPNMQNQHYQDENGNWVLETYPDTNAYEEQRQSGRVELGRNAVQSAQARAELETYLATQDVLKDMPRWQLKNLKEELRTRVMNNSLLEEDVKLMKQYGLSSRDQNGWTALLRATLRNPDAVYNMLDRLIESGSRTAVNFWNRIIGDSDGNPPSGSW